MEISLPESAHKEAKTSRRSSSKMAKEEKSKRPAVSKILNSTKDETDEIIVIETTEARLLEAERFIAQRILNLNTVTKHLTHMSMICAAVQLIQASILFVAVLYILFNGDGRRVRIFTAYPDDYYNDGFEPHLRELAHFSILWYSIVFMVSSGLEHLSCVVFPLTYHWYVERNQNPFRWTEYTFSASLMRVMTAQLAGVTDIHLLFSIFVLSASTIQNGATMESVNAKARADGLPMKWRPFFCAWLTHIVSWLIIWTYFGVSIPNSAEPAGTATIASVLCLSDLTFALLFSFQWLKIGPFKDYVLGEYGFMVLSSTAKSLLAWLSVYYFVWFY